MFTTPIQSIAASALPILFTLALAACGGSDTSKAQDLGSGSSLPDALFIAQAPEGIQAISALKETAQEGDEVVVRAIIGGSMDPIVDGRASATMMDAAISNPCVSVNDHCTTPWDYCCTPQETITANAATLQILDASGSVMKADVSSRLAPMTILVVKGVVGPRPDDKVLTVNAQAIFIEQEAK